MYVYRGKVSPLAALSLFSKKKNKDIMVLTSSGGKNEAIKHVQVDGFPHSRRSSSIIYSKEQGGKKKKKKKTQPENCILGLKEGTGR